ncbi:hypothetical protein GDO81_021037 [Engystomops pustulosus]|uniref:Uncharacterized protein n=1 Tax=Engystomops pustulosus TaxID=76066 RepID=A0AAV6Z7C1_ENGPU|nr:hypothetical protein GDO81_021037 [Engystomops pustulosus]
MMEIIMSYRLGPSITNPHERKLHKYWTSPPTRRNLTRMEHQSISWFEVSAISIFHLGPLKYVLIYVSFVYIFCTSFSTNISC